MLALAYRQEVAHLGVTVGLVHPSWIDTDLVRGAEADLPSFQDLRRRLPYPGNVTTSVDRAAAAIVDGLVRRRSRVYVPARGYRRQLGQSGGEFAGGVAVDEALCGHCGSGPREGVRGIGEAGPTRSSCQRPRLRDRVARVARRLSARVIES